MSAPPPPPPRPRRARPRAPPAGSSSPSTSATSRPAIAFYSAMFGVEPHKRRPGYANFAIAEPPLKLVLIETSEATRGSGTAGALNHLGVEVASTDDVAAARARFTDAGLAAFDENDTTCCYALQDKVWVHDPAGAPWEVYTVKDDNPADARPATASLEILGDGGVLHVRPPAPTPSRAERRPRPAARDRGTRRPGATRPSTSRPGCRRSTGSCRSGSAWRWLAGSLLGPAGARARRRAVGRRGRGRLAADRHRAAGDDVPGAGQGPLRPARHGHRRPPHARRSAWCSTGGRPGADVHPRLGVALRPARVPHRADHRRAGPLHRHGHHLERPRLRRPRGGGGARRPQLAVPGRRVRRARLVLPLGAPRLARARRRRPSTSRRGRSRHRCWSSSASPCCSATSPAASANGAGARARTSVVPPPHRPVGALRAALHHRRALRAPGGPDHRATRSTSPASPSPCSSTSR